MNQDRLSIACCLSVGACPELYLEAMLESIGGVVDMLVVNDNSGLSFSDNVGIIEASRFGHENRLKIYPHTFTDFATMRNDAFGHLRELKRPPDWVLFIDADEVHGKQLEYLARHVLPSLGHDIGQLDGYTYHFFGTFDWISDIARRIIFYRYDPGLHWVNAIHEKLLGVRGSTIVVPYLYHHYGNVLPPTLLARKHELYLELGNPVTGAAGLGEDAIAYYLDRATIVRPYHGEHPHAVRTTIDRLRIEYATLFALVDGEFRSKRSPMVRTITTIQGANEWLRAELRRVEHPGLYRAPSIAE